LGGLYCLTMKKNKEDGQEKFNFLKNLGKKYSKELSNKATIWELEFNAKLESTGESFIFQHPVICKKERLFILDFYIPSLKLAIELDGRSHYTKHGASKDKKRTDMLKKEGIKVVRISNSLVKSITIKNIKELLNSYR